MSTQEPAESAETLAAAMHISDISNEKNATLCCALGADPGGVPDVNIFPHRSRIWEWDIREEDILMFQNFGWRKGFPRIDIPKSKTRGSNSGGV